MADNSPTFQRWGPDREWVQVPKGRLKPCPWSAVPSGLIARSDGVPNVETLGYYRKSLRDRDLPDFCALPTSCLTPLWGICAFTLIELLIVIAIIGILAALLLPVLGRAKESGRSAACLSDLHQIGIALQLYVQDNQNIMPTMYDAIASTNSPPGTNLAAVNIVLTNYLGAPEILRCPSDDRRLYEDTGSSYAWNNLLNGEDADHLEVFKIHFDPHQIPVFYDKEAFHRARGPGKGVNFLYADGHIKNLLELEGTK